MLQLNKKYPMLAHGITTGYRDMYILGGAMYFTIPSSAAKKQNSSMYNNIKNSALILRNYLIQGVKHAN